jgi:hypothetical protein
MDEVKPAALTERAFGPRPEGDAPVWDNNRKWIEALFAVLGHEDLVRHVVILHKDNLLHQPRSSGWVLFPKGTDPDDEALQAAVDQGRMRPEEAEHLRRLLTQYKQQHADLDRLAEEEQVSQPPPFLLPWQQSFGIQIVGDVALGEDDDAALWLRYVIAYKFVSPDGNEHQAVGIRVEGRRKRTPLRGLSVEERRALIEAEHPGMTWSKTIRLGSPESEPAEPRSEQRIERVPAAPPGPPSRAVSGSLNIEVRVGSESMTLLRRGSSDDGWFSQSEVLCERPEGAAELWVDYGDLHVVAPLELP